MLGDQVKARVGLLMLSLVSYPLVTPPRAWDRVKTGRIREKMGRQWRQKKKDGKGGEDGDTDGDGRSTVAGMFPHLKEQ
jgi:hypothetical protein